MKIDFWTNANMSKFWSYVKMLLVGIQPGIMIAVATAAVGLLLGIIIRSYHVAKRQQEHEDEDVEIRHY